MSPEANITPERWDELHAGYVRGDDACAAELFEHITKVQLPRIFGFIDRSLTPDQISELVARLNYKLHHEGKMRQYKGPQKFLAWLRMLAARERANFFREKQRTEKVIRGSTDDEEANLPESDGTGMANSSRQQPDKALVTDEILRAIAACIERLPPRDRQVIEYRATEGYDFAQIAAALNKNTDHAYLLLHRARERLMVCLEKSGVRVPVSRKSVKDKRGKDVSS